MLVVKYYKILEPRPKHQPTTFAGYIPIVGQPSCLDSVDSVLFQLLLGIPISGWSMDAISMFPTEV